MNENKYLSIIGLEVHVELSTKSKMFCGCSADWFGQEPNTKTCPVCLGLPGALPVPNKKAIEWCIMIGLALNCEIPTHSKFDRKNYFYPDLPKGYQISQYDSPFCKNGWLNIKFQIPNSKLNPNAQILNSKKIRIRRVHMEEDTAKLVHQFQTQKSKLKNQKKEKYTLIDFNRSGVPLVEIVTEPDIRSAEEAKEYLQKLQKIIRHLGVSSCDMEKGSMRLEPNVSIVKIQNSKSQTPKNFKEQKLKLPDYKVEVKNINSFRFAKKAIDFEIKRQIEILESGKTPAQETRGWDEKKGITISQRSKEEAKDYRYFPEPDIPPIVWKKEDLEAIKNQMPESSEKKEEKYVKWGIKPLDVHILTSQKNMAAYFESVLHELSKIDKTDVVNLHLKTTGAKSKQLSIVQLVANLIINKKIPTSITPKEFASKVKAVSANTATDLNKLNFIIRKHISNNPKLVEEYKNGKEAVINVLIGMVMKEIKGAADPSIVKDLLKKELQK